MDIICLDAHGNVDYEMMAEWDEYDRLNAQALADSPFSVGDRVKLNSKCPKDTRDMCRVRVGDVGTLLGVSTWPTNDRVIVQMDVRWDHEDEDDPVYLGIYEEYLENGAG